MAQAVVVIETPALAEVGVPILVDTYDVQREINGAGAWTVSFPATQMLAKQVRSRWRISIIEEGRLGYLLRRGIVMTRTYRVAADGTGILSLAGYTRLYQLAASSTHLGLAYDGSQTIETIANDLTGESVTVPTSASTRTPKVTFSDMSKLEALLSACELARYNVRETFAEDGFELVEQDDVPDSGYRFVNVQQAGPELENAAANGMGLIAGTPTIGYEGKDLATRVIPTGTDFDGKPLNLGSSNKLAPYTIQSALNPDGTTYYYLEDSDAVTVSGVVEFQYIRADVKNPSDNAGTKLAAANVLYAVAAGELIKRRYDVISFASEIANGHQIDALPGDRVLIQFRGFARTPYGTLTWQDIDANFLIIKRRDASNAAGVRGVSFTLAAPEVPYTIPALPDAVPIPPPPKDPPDPPYPGGDNGGDSGGDNGTDSGGGDTPGDTGIPDVPPFTDPGLPDIPQLNPNGPQNYQPCCAPPTQITDHATPPGGGGVGDVTPKLWLQNDVIPPDAVLLLYVSSVWNGAGTEEAHSTPGTDVTITPLGDHLTTIKDSHGSGSDGHAHHYYYKVKATGPSPAVSVLGSGGGNVQGDGYIFFGTPTVDITNFAVATTTFVRGDAGVSLSIAPAGDIAAAIYGVDWQLADVRTAAGFPVAGSLTHSPTLDGGWSVDPRAGNASTNGPRGAVHKTGGGTALATFDVNNTGFISPTDPSTISVASVEITI